MKKAKKILTFGPNIKIYSFMLLTSLAVALIPLFLLTKYAIPFFDDYGYSAPVWIHYMLGGYRLRGVISGSLENVVHMWHTWQGTYSSIFFMGLNPMIFGEQYYVIGPVFVLCNFVFSLFVFVFVTVRHFFQKSGIPVLGLFSGIALFLILFLYSPQQGFYWFNGGIHYIGMFSFELLFLSVLMLLCGKPLFSNSRSDSKKNKITGVVQIVIGVIASMILGFVVAGANFVTTLQTMILLFSGILLSVYFKNKKVLLWIPSLISFGIGFYLNLSAPGNAVRSAYFPDSPDAVHAILLSFPESISFLKRFLDVKTVLFLLLLFPFAWVLTVKNKNESKFRYPVWGIPLVMVWSYCLYAACFTPGLYGTGAVNLSRMINVIKITFQFLLVVNMFYITGAVFRTPERKKATVNASDTDVSEIIVSKEKEDSAKSGFKVPLVALVLWLALFALCFAFCKDRVGNYSSYGAYHYLADGEAKLFHAQYEARLAKLKTPEMDIRFEPYSVRPWFLIWQDLSADPGDDQNKEMAYYYGKNSVAIE
ncbi:MAG: hypothetical protein IKO32_06435 [Lachnospiraceae bacterium]|nr:hypothetical protein [Lachnospiraceae bacterium]